MTERLLVLLFGEVVGFLERSDGVDPSFTYTPEYAATGMVPLSSQLPLTRTSHPPAKVAPFLAGLVPESDAARFAWADELGTAPDDVFGLLATMGWDCPGAVQFCREQDLDLLAARGLDFERLTEADIAGRIRGLATGANASWTMPGEHWSLGGQQEKFALALVDGHWFEARGSAPTTHIFKPGIRHLLHQALVEHLTMAAAARVGVEVAESTFERFEDQWAIVVSRFDRHVTDGRIRRLHQEDFAQACGRMPVAKYESRGGPTLADMMRVVSRESTEPLDDRLALADFLIINLVAGAPDGHSKNISLLRAEGFTAVAPLYDLATGLAYDARTVDRAVALSIGGERLTSRIHHRQWERAAATLGLPSHEVTARVAALAGAFPEGFRASAEELPDDVPGLDEVIGRTLPALEAHAERVLATLD